MEDKGMKKVSISYSIIIIILFVALNSCSRMNSGTKLIATWKDKSYNAGYINSILIVGMSDDTSTRKLFEDIFTERFNSANVKAASSMAIISSSKEMDKDTIKSAAEAESMKAVLVTHLEASGKKKVYQPSPTGPSSNVMNFGLYYDSVYHNAEQLSGTYKKQEFVKLVTNIYETATEQLIWSGVSESINPKSDERIIETLVKDIIRKLHEKSLIK